MNGYNFTERVRKVLAMAQEESVALHHEYVGTEHILLALLAEGESVAVAVLQHFKVDLDEARGLILNTVKTGRAASRVGTSLPYTSRAKSVLELAMDESRVMGHHYIGTEHLLIGLLREEKGIAAQILMHSGLSTKRARAEVLRLLGAEFPSRVESPSGVSTIGIEIRRNDGTVERIVVTTLQRAMDALSERL